MSTYTEEQLQARKEIMSLMREAHKAMDDFSRLWDDSIAKIETNQQKAA